MKKFGLAQARKILPKRKRQSHKGDYGRVIIFAGSRRYPGAGVLAANAATRMGAGYVVLSTDMFLKKFMEIPEVIFQNRSRWSWKTAQREWVYVIGPGMGLQRSSQKILMFLLENKFPHVVVDADALTLLSLWNKKVPSTWVLTPHEEELSRLIHLSIKEIKKDRVKSISCAVKKFGCCILLKGHPTLVSGGKETVEILSGNAALAKAGSGDVLSGFIGALKAQHLDSFHAASLGAFIHGLLADQWVKSGRDELTLLPSDLTREVPKLVSKIRANLL